VKVELNRKTVQHQEGGIVREILVRNGQSVRAGDPLVVVGDVRSDAELSLLQNQWHSERVRIARATAEGALAARFGLPADVAGTPQAAEYLARERALFAARRRTLEEHVASLQTQMREAHAQAEALETQIAATQTGAQLSAEELQRGGHRAPAHRRAAGADRAGAQPVPKPSRGRAQGSFSEIA
jgi:multidrug efflux pump subunit AcrA (membrane-fusion protein)